MAHSDAEAARYRLSPTVSQPATVRSVLRRAKNLIKFRLERFMLRGAGSRLLVIAALIGLLSLTCGYLVYGVAGGFDDGSDAVWWAFLRLTDPGYLGDDIGTFRRVVSTFLTVAGYVVFLGALVAIMTQWLNQTIRRLESGLTPIAQNDHVLIVGWTTRTVTILRELLESEGRVRRFLLRFGKRRKLHVVVLDEEVGPELAQEIRERLGATYRPNTITLRSGSSLRIQHLQRVDFAHAAAIVVAGDDVLDPGAADTATIKTLLSMSTHGQILTGEDDLPIVVAEVFDARKLHVARGAYDGRIEVLASERAISRLIVQMMRIPGVYDVYEDLITGGEGNAIYVREAGALAGRTFGSIAAAYACAIPIGIARAQGKSFRPILVPDRDTQLLADDRIVFVADDYDSTVPDERAPPLAAPSESEPEAPSEERVRRRILIVGWSHKALPMLQELERYVGEDSEVDVFSASPIAEREALLSAYAQLERVKVRMLQGDRTMPSEVRELAPQAYDHIVLLGSDSSETKEESDARTVVTYLLLREVLESHAGARPRIYVELFDRSNEVLFEDQPVDVFVSPRIVGRMLAQIALRQELRAVFDQLLGSRGPDLACRRPAFYGARTGEPTFRELQAAAISHGDILLGVKNAAGFHLNPEHDSTWPVDDTQLLVLARDR